MKRLFAILLAVTLFASMATVVSAANTTTLTTTVPAATYTLNIPADQKIDYGATSKTIGSLTVTEATGFAESKNLKVTITYSDFTCEDVSTTIPMSMGAHYANTYGSQAFVNTTIASGESLTFKGNADGGVDLPTTAGDSSTLSLVSLNVKVENSDWGKALAGDYTATITFTAEVVAE